MVKSRSSFVCQNCGAVASRWQGRCESCGEWNTIVEEAGSGPTAARAARGRPFELEGLAGSDKAAARIVTGINEFDRVTGGGFVPGSALLLGGEPGIGKSTLLIQACAALARRGARVIYISGEEAVAQVRLRAGRLNLADAPVELASATQVEDILATCATGERAALIVIDSIQTMHTDVAPAAPGTVTQVRASAQALLRHAKTSGSTIMLIGHVTKDGQVAGPRVVEHMVDAVLSFEGDAAHHFRMLRASKNRFGATGEIGVFEMTGLGLAEVANPSAIFLAGRDASAPGAAVFAGMEGQRPMLIEIQALVAPTSLGTPRRAVVGFDQNRLSMILAVLEAHGGLKLGMHDVYLNVAGGMRADEPAGDLAAAAALVSSLTGAALPADQAFFGEIGLSGAVRPVIHAGMRLREAQKLGFHQAVLAQGQQINADDRRAGLALRPCADVAQLVATIAQSAPRAKGRN
ncbi:DNA repair protein RadA [Methylocystis sp. S23]|jgi:DNA repair protein RadA/Sms